MQPLVNPNRSFPGGWCSASSPATTASTCVATFVTDVTQPRVDLRHVATFSKHATQPLRTVVVVGLRRSNGDASPALDRKPVGVERRRLPARSERWNSARRRPQEDELGQRQVGSEILTDAKLAKKQCGHLLGASSSADLKNSSAFSNDFY